MVNKNSGYVNIPVFKETRDRIRRNLKKLDTYDSFLQEVAREKGFK